MDELATVLRALGHMATQEELEIYRNEFNADGNDTIDFENFKQIMIQRLKKDDREEELINAFRAFEKDNKGVINSEKFKEDLINYCNGDLNED